MIDLLNQSDSNEMTGATHFYLFERLAQLYQQNSIIRAKYFGSGTVEECITLAIDILKLLVFNGGGEGASLSALRLQARYLSTAIQATGGGMFWRTRMELFVWLVFLVYVCNPTGSYRTWSVFVIKGALEHVFGLRVDWSNDTINRLEKMLLTFGWSCTDGSFADLKQIASELWN